MSELAGREASSMSGCHRVGWEKRNGGDAGPLARVAQGSGGTKKMTRSEVTESRRGGHDIRARQVRLVPGSDGDPLVRGVIRVSKGAAHGGES